jgi:hypothetical protein
MSAQTWRQRRLGVVEDQLEDLMINLQHPGTPCQMCGSYRSLDQETTTTIEEMKAMLAKVRSWQSAPWAEEGKA